MAPCLTPLPDDLDDVTSVLLLVRSGSPQEDELCGELLTPVPPDEVDFLGITFTQPPADRLAIWKQQLGEYPARAAIISVGAIVRSSTTASIDVEVPPEYEGTLAIDAISDPGNLTDLGVRITDHLDTWHDPSNQLVMCFHSLTALLQYADLNTAYRFLHTLTGHMNQADALAHYHMASHAHDRRTVATLKQLVDAVVTIDSDGTPTISTR